MMPRSAPPFIKICCISSVAEARLAVSAGAAALGLVSSMPSGPGVIDEGLIQEIAACMRQDCPAVETFLLTAHTRAQAIAEQHARTRTTTLQLVDQVPHDDLRQLRHLCPGVKLVQVVHVQDDASAQEAAAVAPWVDALLLDSGNPKLAVKELGGTGRTHDWATSRRIRDALHPTPVILAGGLQADNVRQAMVTVQPYGLDLCSKVRTDGRLDATKLHAFMAAVRAEA